MPPVYCGSIASVRSPTPACPYGVSASCSTALHCSLFLVQAFKHRLASVSRLLTVLAGAISSLSIEVVEDCFIGLPIGLPLQPARVDSYPVLSLTREALPDESSGSVLASRVTVEGQAPLKVSGQKLPVRVFLHLQSCRGIRW